MVDVVFGMPKELSEVMVVVDVFRSSTTIVSALDNGAKYIIPCDSVEEARKIKKEVERRLGRALLIGEEMGLTPKGFDLNISPQSMRKELIGGKMLIHSSTNLTKILHHCRTAKILLIGGLVNARAVARYLERTELRNVTIVACGVLPRNVISVEDVVGAGAIINSLAKAELSDSAMLSCLVYQNSRWREWIYDGFVVKYLTKIGFGEDIRYCLQENVSDTVPILKNGRILRLKEAVRP